MPKVDCALETTLVLDAGGRAVDGLCLTCGDCMHSVEGAGRPDDQQKVSELLGKLHRTCPLKEDNRYAVISD